jgi:hypothetical protein
LLSLDDGTVAIDDSSENILASIWSSCSQPITLTTSLNSTNAIEHWLEALDNPEIVTEALNLVNVRFRTILLRQDLITVEVYEDSPSNHIRERMKSHGWTIRTTENLEEEVRNLSDYNGYSDDDDCGYSDDDGHDEYDIDDDDDFWRRAGD